MNRQDPLFLRTVLGVSAVHAAILALCMYHFDEAPSNTSAKRIAVKTIALEPVEKVMPKQTSAKKTHPVVAKKDKPKGNKKLQQAKNTLAALHTEKNSATLQDLKNISMRTDEMGGVTEASYEDFLIEMLVQELRLPEAGDVKIALTLAKTGEVRRVQVLESQNQRNKEAVEKLVKGICFPPFGKEMKGKNEKTFTILVRGKC